MVSALDTLAAELEVNRLAHPNEYAERLQTYLDAQPRFYGAAAALLDHDGMVTASLYVYRTDDGYVVTDLAEPSCKIHSHAGVSEPLTAAAAVGTEPYFDAGSGEIWMVTRSVPVQGAEGIFAIVTTDLPVEAPTR